MSDDQANGTQVRALLAQASELPADQRPHFLSRACGQDAALRAQVEGLLSMLEQAEGFLSPPGADRPQPLTGVSEVADEQFDDDHDDERPALARAADAPGVSAGTVIHHYRLLNLIGEGGFGRVYLAEQAHPVQRQVALKIIKPGMHTRQVVARFQRERQALAMMDHPNIARVLDAGSTEGGRPYVVMELVRGVPITEYCDAVSLSVRERLRLFVQVCNAVQHAHQKGIIHRDLKPGNVLVTMADGQPIPKVIDFGVAKAIGGSLSEATTIGDGPRWMGTPQYMSPEQAGGGGAGQTAGAGATPADIDTRSDIYSLGVLLYELLTGTTPFDSQQLREAPFGEMQRVICEVEPARPSLCVSATQSRARAAVAGRRQADPRRLSQIMRGELDWIVMRCLEKDRTRRYETAAALARDVAHYLKGEPVQAGPPSTAYRLSRFVRRHKVSIAAAALVLLALVLGTVGTAIGLVRARHAAASALAERDLAARQSMLARQQAIRADAISGFLLRMLASADPQRARRQDLLVRDALDHASQEIEQKPPADAQTAEAVHHTLGESYAGLGLYARAATHFRAALALRQTMNGPSSLEAARCMGELADALWADLQYAPAEPLYWRSLQIRQAALGEENAEVAGAMQRVANMLLNEKQAEHYYQRSLAIRRKLLGEQNVDTAQSLYGLGLLRRDHGHRAEAEALFQHALSVQRKLLGDDSPTVAQTTFALATVSTPDAVAQQVYEQALATQRRALGPEHPDVAVTMMYLALNMMDQGNYGTRPEALLNEAMQINRKTFGPVHGQLARDLQALAQLHWYRGELPEAQRDFERALAMYRQTLGEQAIEVVWVLRDMVPVMMAQREFQQIQDLLEPRYAWAIAHPRQDPRSFVRKQAEMQLVELYRAWDKREKLAEWSATFKRDFPEGVDPANPTLTPSTRPTEP